MIDETLDIPSLDLAEGRAKIQAVRDGLGADGGQSSEAVRATIAKLDRIERQLKGVGATLENVGVPV